MSKPKNITPLIEKRTVKHLFTPEELAELNLQFGQAYDAVQTAESDFAAVKAVHKAKIEEASSRMVTLRATINAGFEMRSMDLEVFFFPKEGMKEYSIPRPGGSKVPRLVMLREKMEPADYDQELFHAESIFEDRESVLCWIDCDDRASIRLGTHNGKWYSAVNGRLLAGKSKLDTRLDSFQKAYKTRFDALQAGANLLIEWAEETLGKEPAKALVATTHELINTEAAKAV